jgi:hypothetical protein
VATAWHRMWGEYSGDTFSLLASEPKDFEISTFQVTEILNHHIYAYSSKLKWDLFKKGTNKNFFLKDLLW